jgi:transcription initiation factor TFIIE subunit beta
MDDVTDAYPGAVDDCEALIAEGLVLMLTNAETRERVLYPVDERYECEVDDDMATLFHAVPIPEHDNEFDAALRKAGHEPAPRRAARPTGHDSDDEGGGRKRARAKKKRKVNFERMKVTNAHLPELFKGLENITALDQHGASSHKAK